MESNKAHHYGIHVRNDKQTTSKTFVVAMQSKIDDRAISWDATDLQSLF